MSVSTKEVRRSAMNLPNQLTALRLVLAIALFVVITYGYYFAGFWMFLVAASTDWLDGYFARKYGMVTVVGRIFDPFVDKVIVCGTFIFLVAVPDSGVRAWMAVVIVGRELLVTALRSFIENQGTDFSASMSGKLKMVLQCVAAAASLYYLAHPSAALEMPLLVLIWAAVLITLYSGVGYIVAAARLMRV